MTPNNEPSPTPPLSADTLLADITSGDVARIRSSASAIIHTRDTTILDSLCTEIARIRAATQKLELGGMLVPNRLYPDFALRTLEYYRSGAGCLCRLYPEYLFFDPNKEAKEGKVRIEEQHLHESGWGEVFTCACAQCGARYQVMEQEYHYAWWEWKKSSG